MPLYFKSSPAKTINGTITVSGDKSISHRALIFGAIAEGKTTVQGFLKGEDCLATCRAFQSMGVQIDLKEDQVEIQGAGKYGLKKPNAPIDCGNSGTTMRLLAGLLACQTFDTVLTGDASLLKRPMARIAEPLTRMGAKIQTVDGKAPLSIYGNQEIQGIAYTLPEASAQVKSCLMLAGLYAKGETQLTEDHLTRDHSEKMLAAFSYPLNKIGQTLGLNAHSRLIGTNLKVPADLSSAAFFIVLATILPNSSLRINQVGVNPTRTGVLALLKKMGARIALTNHCFYHEEPVADILVESADLKGIDISEEWVSLSIDEFPILFIAAACAKGKTTLTGAKELKTKESDRLTAMVSGLQALGIQAMASEDGAVIEGGQLQGGTVDACHDHRIAMAFAIAGSVAKGDVLIKHCENVVTSFPDFITLANSLNFSIKDFYAS